MIFLLDSGDLMRGCGFLVGVESGFDSVEFGIRFDSAYVLG